MKKEVPSFLSKVNDSLNTVRNDVAQRNIQSENENRVLENKRALERLALQNRIESTEREFTELGVVAAFNEIIESKFLFISDESIKKYEPIYNFFGRKTGEKVVKIPNFIPAYIDFDENSVKLVVEKHTESDIRSYSDYATVECEQYILVRKEDNGKFSLGFFGTTSTSVREIYQEIKKTECNEDVLIENLAKLVAVYREIITVKQKRDFSQFFNEQKEKNLLPHFP